MYFFISNCIIFIFYFAFCGPINYPFALYCLLFIGTLQLTNISNQSFDMFLSTIVLYQALRLATVGYIKVSKSFQYKIKSNIKKKIQTLTDQNYRYLLRIISLLVIIIIMRQTMMALEGIWSRGRHYITHQQIQTWCTD